MFLQRAIRQLDGVIVASFNDYPCAIGIKGFTNADAAGAFLRYPVEVLFCGIKEG